jgi:hypothetical protein
MDDEGGEPFYAQALGFRLRRLPQYISLTIAFSGYFFLGFCSGLIYKVGVAATQPNKVESVFIAATLYYTQGKRHESALLLGYGRNTLRGKLKSWNWMYLEIAQ